MKITDGEKLILLMLSELYVQLKIEGEIEPEFIQSAIYSQNEWGIPWKYSGIPFEDQETPPKVREVLDILDMWSFIEKSYNELSDEDKLKLEKDAEPFGKDPKFPGFDGNNESEHMNIASFLINNLGRFQIFKDRSLNSHMPTLETSHRMLSSFEPIRNTLSLDPMTVDELIIVLKEIIHPDYR
ncbi:MAG: YfbU family protein [Sphaerochaetaceae bacterium]|jgi:uncharacterized protein YfbU (UPF0304 family)